ncbi:ATPase [Candidatus Woesearchaeota archaeon]|nr:MAG: ATPase [Candidatus Woesearchaeota archaeon]
MKTEKLAPDTSAIIEGTISERIKTKKIETEEILIHEALIAELEHQANEGKSTGFRGLEELKELKELEKKGKFKLTFAGKRPTYNEIKYSFLGEIDSQITQLAWENSATLITADKVQAKTAEAKGIQVIFIEKKTTYKKIKLENYFDKQTMSVHLRENNKAMAKKGIPGNWTFEECSKKELTKKDIEEISREIIDEARCRTNSFIEIEREGSTIVQLEKYRIVILFPPFSDKWEITAVRPIKQLKLEDYKISNKLKERLNEAEGILIAGAPGMGKSTFAQALAEHYSQKGKIVKTVEAPRDLILPKEITQLAISHSSPEEIRDVLLLSRPDYTLFDEMRNTTDFLLYSDMRLAGVGMVGVIHGTNPLDSIQRFIGKIELGVIPHIIDTVIFIKNGEVNTVLNVKMKVKVPAGMTEADLARPVITVKDFETEKIIAEIYSYGEETVVIPVKEATKETGIKALAAKEIERKMQRYTDKIKVEIPSEDKAIVYVPEKYIAGIIGKEGKKIAKTEEELGISIDVRELKEENKTNKQGIKYSIGKSKKYIEFIIGEEQYGKEIHIYIGKEYLATFAVGKKGTIKIKKTNKLGKTILNAIKDGEKIKLIEV